MVKKLLKIIIIVALLLTSRSVFAVDVQALFSIDSSGHFVLYAPAGDDFSVPSTGATAQISLFKATYPATTGPQGSISATVTHSVCDMATIIGATCTATTISDDINNWFLGGGDGTYWFRLRSTQFGSYPDYDVYYPIVRSGGSFTPVTLDVYPTFISLFIPTDNATSTPTDQTLFWKYYINSVATGTLPTMEQIIIKPLKTNFFGLGTTNPVYINKPLTPLDFLVNDSETVHLKDGVYTWQGTLQNYTVGTQTCSYLIFCLQGLSGTSTIASSQIFTFTVGGGGFYGTTTDAGNKTTNPFKWCSEYTGGNVIVTALCFIPASIDYAVTSVFVPSDSDVLIEQSRLSEAINNIFTIAPWGYFTRAGAILTSTATSTLPSFTFQLPSGPLASSTITIDPQDMLDGGGAILMSLEDPISHKSLREITEPFLLLFLALTVIGIIVSDLMGSHKHHPN